MGEPWRRADELISDVEEELIDTPATITAFGDPELRGVDAMADVPFPLQTIEDPPDIPEEEEADPELDVDAIQDLQEIQDAADPGGEEPAGVIGAEVTPEREQAREGEEDDMARTASSGNLETGAGTERASSEPLRRLQSGLSDGAGTRAPLAIEQLSAPAQHRYLLEQETA